MITVEAIIENGAYSPEKVPDTKHGSHFDGTHFVFFESEEERIEYLKQFENESKGSTN